MKECIDNIATPISDLLYNTLACCVKTILFFLVLWFIVGGVKFANRQEPGNDGETGFNNDGGHEVRDGRHVV
ncbi:hypothetical protein CEXT_85261 [Caerostris extrusa]|uniref:Uncharacterized protein n=1 Tax=Caerostris extrusa TaxID=172846 RepID=A0AAV4RTC0_CAEEX|nr:hypothetical protein CEXT_318471 [Caerostris extrusa]GIY53855.1 hypothetical protein CEXT_85261 [Caerostris extrusa]